MTPSDFFLSKRVRYGLSALALAYIVLFYSTRFISYNGHNFSFKEYNSLISFNGNSNKIQTLRFAIAENKSINIFWTNLNEKYTNQDTIYSLFKIGCFFCWGLLGIMSGTWLYKDFLTVRKENRIAAIGTIMIIGIVYLLAASLGRQHHNIYLNYNPPPERTENQIIFR